MYLINTPLQRGVATKTHDAWNRFSGLSPVLSSPSNTDYKDFSGSF